MSVISDSQGLLNDLFTNNVNYVATQMQLLIDFLFPNNDDNSETLYTYNPYIVTGQCVGELGEYVGGGLYRHVYGIYNVNFESSNSESYISFVSSYGDAFNQSSYDNIVNAKKDSYSIKLSPSRVGHDIRPNQNVGGAPIWDFTSNIQCNSLWTNKTANVTDKSGNTVFLYGTNDTPSWSPYTNNCPPIILVSSDGCRTFVVTDIPSATDIYNNGLNFNNDYHVSNTFNFNGGSSGGGGTVFVGGGAGGIAVGLGGAVGYADIEFALDSLIDDLNINLGGNNKLPVSTFPSYDEIKYGDRGSFYITPIKQIDKLPVAPDIADSVIDVSEPLGILSTGFGALLDSFNNIGVTLTLTFTFLSCLIINKLRGD